MTAAAPGSPPAAAEPVEPTPKEIQAALTWLAQRGVRLVVPTRLLCIRLGMRFAPRLRTRTCLVALGVAILGSAGLFGLRYLPGVGKQFPGGSYIFVVVATIQLTVWYEQRHRDRQIAARLACRVTRVESASRLRLLGGWFAASVVLTFGGGAGLALAVALTSGAPAYGWAWLALLGVAAVSSGIALTSVLRAPAVAENDASLAVDDQLRIRDADNYVIPVFAIPPLNDLTSHSPLPPPFAPYVLAYVVLSVGAMFVTMLLRHLPRHRSLPPGNYGLPQPS
ncbi:hypothetical protein [Amycolatopsis sp. NPDC059021]|uniref:hypothetical protein n=1 Tax=Amycolatopsis sp. NPDC059021 TaxID=3346704 RepID=UPI00366ACF37